ncbi:hypothetical protein WN943_007492 [Citrus x changshan-huyou]
MPGVFNFERELPESKGPTGGDKVFGLLCVRSVNSSATVHTSLYLHALNWSVKRQEVPKLATPASMSGGPTIGDKIFGLCSVLAMAG